MERWRFDLPGAYQIASPFLLFRLASKVSMASCEHPMLLPSAMNFAPALINASASSPETSFCVALGRATSTFSTWVHGRAPSMYLYLSLNWEVVEISVSCLRSTFSFAIRLISSGVMPFSSVAIMQPLLSDREMTVAPSSMAFRAAYWATLPEPEIATRLPWKDSLPPEAYWIMCWTYCNFTDISSFVCHVRNGIGRVISYVDKTVTSGFRPDQAASPASSLSGQDTLPETLLGSVGTE